MFSEGGYTGYFKSKKNLLKKSKAKLSYIDSADKVIKIKYKTDNNLVVYQEQRLAILKPVTSYTPTKDNIKIYTNIKQPRYITNELNKLKGLVALDIETKGTQAADKETEIVGIGLASAEYIKYVCLKTCSDDTRQAIYWWLVNHKDGFIGHNIFFDGTYLMRDTGYWLNWRYCTYGLYKQLASEGYPGQRWSLKSAQVQLLNWEDKGDVELNRWLVDNNYITSVSKTKLNEDMVYREDTQRWCRPDKSQMYRAPADILGYYCGLDAASTYQLLSEVFLPSIKAEPYEEVLLQYHCSIFTENVRLHSEQQLSGICIKQTELEKYHTEVLEKIDEHQTEFLNHPQVRPFADIKNKQAIENSESAEPDKFKKVKWPKEPRQFKTDGTISKSWLKYKDKLNKLMTDEPEITKRWEQWATKHQQILTSEHFNPSSSDQLRMLFYEHLKYPTIIKTDKGLPSTGAKALPGFGEVGKVLKKQKDDIKLEGYIRACLSNLIDGRLHPQFRMPGTLTCRLAGAGGINLQQIPKDKRYLQTFLPDKGRAWVACDHTSLEQVVLAELSKDESLYNIYGPNAKPNDIYLYNGSKLPIIGEKIINAGYCPDNPTPEMIEYVKSVCKQERTISKIITLGSSYGMGWQKLKLTLSLEGIPITDNQAQVMVKSYWSIYKGVKRYEEFLLEQYHLNNGYVLNGIGRPVGCAEDYLKDIVNRVVQSTGHDIHMLYIYICSQLLDEAGIQVSGIVWDFHDESIVECREQDKEKVFDILGREAYDILNKQYLKGVIPLKGDPEFVNNMAEVKC